MTKRVRIENADTANYKVVVQVWDKGAQMPDGLGGYWIKTERGWKWCTGSTFPRPGGDWTGELIPPEPAAA